MTGSQQALSRGLTGLMAFQAWGSIRSAKNWADEKNYNLEVSDCVIAQLLIGIVIESAINEVADGLFPKTAWSGIEKTDTKTKWWIASGHGGRVPFDYGAEPMQTVHDVMSIRNKLAHPKIYKFDPEIILQRMDGTLERGVDPQRAIQPGETAVSAAIKFHEDEGFNFELSFGLIKRATSALIKLREHMQSEHLKWAYELRNHIEGLPIGS